MVPHRLHDEAKELRLISACKHWPLFISPASSLPCLYGSAEISSSSNIPTTESLHMLLTWPNLFLSMSIHYLYIYFFIFSKLLIKVFHILSLVYSCSASPLNYLYSRNCFKIKLNAYKYGINIVY